MRTYRPGIRVMASPPVLAPGARLPKHAWLSSVSPQPAAWDRTNPKPARKPMRSTTMPPAAHDPEPHLASDEELQQTRIGKLVPHNGPIMLAAYDPGWPGLFTREAARIRAILGGAALQVEHVGSTSVPGLAAKPIIDILLAVPDSADEPSYAPALQRAGYVLRNREPSWFEHRLFKGPDTDINMHVFTTGAAEI